MRRRFRGSGPQKVDGKGRVSIPHGFRAVLQKGDPDWEEGAAANLVIVYGDDTRKFLECYTLEAIDEVDAAIARIPRGSPDRIYMERFFSGFATDASVDSGGRLVLPKKCREKIGVELNSDAFFMASGDTFQIWKPETYDSHQFVDPAQVFEGLPEGADPAMILDRYREVGG